MRLSLIAFTAGELSEDALASHLGLERQGAGEQGVLRGRPRPCSSPLHGPSESKSVCLQSPRKGFLRHSPVEVIECNVLSCGLERGILAGFIVVSSPCDIDRMTFAAGVNRGSSVAFSST